MVWSIILGGYLASAAIIFGVFRSAPKIHRTVLFFFTLAFILVLILMDVRVYKHMEFQLRKPFVIFETDEWRFVRLTGKPSMKLDNPPNDFGREPLFGRYAVSANGLADRETGKEWDYPLPIGAGGRPVTEGGRPVVSRDASGQRMALIFQRGQYKETLITPSRYLFRFLAFVGRDGEVKPAARFKLVNHRERFRMGTAWIQGFKVEPLGWDKRGSFYLVRKGDPEEYWRVDFSKK